MSYSCPHYLREMQNFSVPYDICVHIVRIDLIRNNDGSFYILDDNLLTPIGVSYILENRGMTNCIFPYLLPQSNVCSVAEYPTILQRNLVSLSPQQKKGNTCLKI